ncbi:USP28_2 [Blepharisma stoltei]|uniref:ubiquitinyl hydrolase 1 n=1 Tax=Blepharisma stoltei TaxID=1481888 RepID=A0AAU9IXL4_9CILI|nr:unnamed protein product [Blepharisma stoltei]
MVQNQIPVSENSISLLIDMGFSRTQAVEALQKFKNNQEEALSYLLDQGTESYDPELKEAINQSLQTNFMESNVVSKDDENLSKAIEDSLKETSWSSPSYTFEPLNPEQRQRTEGVPVGLKYIDHASAFNSLLQSYFMVPKITQEILQFRLSASLLYQLESGSEGTKMKTSIKLIEQLRQLFAHMIKSNKKYADPSGVLNALVDDSGNQMELGDQKNAGFFNMNFISKIEEGFKTKFLLERGNDNQEINVSEGRRKESVSLTEEQLPEGIISQLFYGRQVYFLKSQDSDVFNSPGTFGQILLDLKDKNLYRAWDCAFNRDIQEYKPNENAYTNAHQEIWIDKLPGLLFFQIQRVQAGSLTKNSDAFQFPNSIYTDRFLLKNKELSLSLRERMLNLKKRVVLLEQSIEKFKKFNSNDLRLDVMLQQVAVFLGNQLNLTEIMETDENTGKEADRVEIDSGMLPEISQSKCFFEELAGNVQGMINDMEIQLDRHKKEIEAIFDINELKQHRYQLHSILMHEGSVEGGHYYAFIYDPEYSIWRKYNDVNVTEVKEYEVMAEAIGGHGSNSAYGLIYIDSNLIPNFPKGRLRSYSLNTPNEIPQDHYKSLVPDDLRREIDEENKKAYDEVIEYKLSLIIKAIQDLYTVRQTTAYAQYQSYLNQKNTRQESMKHELINFAVYLKIRYEEQLSRYFILDICVKECNPDYRSLSELDKTEPLWAKLNGQFKSVCKDLPFRFELTQSEKEKLNKEKTTFFTNYCDALICVYILENLIQEKFFDAFHGIAFHLSLGNDATTEYQKIPVDANKILVLRLTSNIFYEIAKGNINEAFYWANHTAFMTSLFITNDDIHYIQVLRRIEAAHRAIRETGNMTEKNNEDFGNLIQNLKIGQCDPTFNFEDLPKELEELKIVINSIDPYSWIEGWRKEEVATKFIEAINKLAKSKISTWQKLHEKLIRQRSCVADGEFREIDNKLISEQ